MARLILLRHGQSVWNRDDRFTGWTDVDLSEKGLQEAKAAGQLYIGSLVAVIAGVLRRREP